MGYKYGDSIQLTAHFNTKEFRCKCGKHHDFSVNSELVEKLEELHGALNCSKIIVTSGYRCSTHDKAVGGSGTGQHTKGTAADICCYAQDGSIISSKNVCCTAQDLGFSGIANIDSTYTATHVDTRISDIWYGDEVVTTAYSVTNDFYRYYGVSKQPDSVSDTTKIIARGIDVSYCQGAVDWEKVKASGTVDFAILQAGYGKEYSQIDEQFERNYSECKRLDIPVGVYWYSYATTVEDAKKEAQTCLQTIVGKSFEYPIYLDLEEKKQFALGKKACSDIVQAFCDEIEKAGYYAGLYCSTYYLTNYVSESVRKRYAVWVAQYNDKCSYTGDYGIWQKSNEGKVSGIGGNVDLDECYIDYPTVIKKAGLNGFNDDISTDVSIGANTADEILEDIKEIYDKYKK